MYSEIVNFVDPSHPGDGPLPLIRPRVARDFGTHTLIRMQK